MKFYGMLLAREYWEHRRAWFGIFGVFGGLLLFVFFVVLIKGGDNAADFFLSLAEKRDFFAELGGDGESHAQIDFASGDALSHASMAFNYLFVFLSTFVGAFYLLGALFDDRKDRSILFWKSLPVSEWQSVGVKFFVGVLIVPLLALAISIAVAFVSGLALSVWVSGFTDLSGWSFFWDLNILQNTFFVAFLSVMSALFVAPYASWLIFASAAARRSPLAFAIVPPLFIVIFESLIFGESRFFEMLVHHQGFDFIFPDDQPLLRWQHAASQLARVLTSWEVYAGLVVSAGLLCASVWLRKFRYEI